MTQLIQLFTTYEASGLGRKRLEMQEVRFRENGSKR